MVAADATLPFEETCSLSSMVTELVVDLSGVRLSYVLPTARIHR
jgi:hypothetical protein